MEITLIAAMERNRGIGFNNTLPWRLKSDLEHFKQYTLGKAIVMGSNTLRSLPGVLKGRETILLSHRYELARKYGPKVTHAKSIPDVLMFAEGKDELVIAGGAMVYEQFLDIATKLVITHIHANIPCDTYFPAIDHGWEMVDNKLYPKDENNQYEFTVTTYIRHPK